LFVAGALLAPIAGALTNANTPTTTVRIADDEPTPTPTLSLPGTERGCQAGGC